MAEHGLRATQFEGDKHFMSSILEMFSLANLIDFSALPLLGSAVPDWLKWFLELDDKLKELIGEYGLWTHVILFVIVFCETGLVVTPFLPGDSLLFAAGALAADRSLRIEWLLPLLIVAAILGDTVNYGIGYWIGEHAFSGTIPFLKKSHLDKTHAYFEKYGGKTIIIARFVPIVRTFAPFVAGVGSMSYRYFLTYNVIGGIVWVVPILYAGYFFGGFEVVQKNFELVVLGIIAVSLLPIFFEWWSHRPPKPPKTSPAIDSGVAS